MTNERKRVEKFCNIRGGAEFREAIQVMRMIGYEIIRMHGSHFIFESLIHKEAENITIPVHHNKIKKIYVKRIQKLIKLYYEKI